MQAGSKVKPYRRGLGEQKRYTPGTNIALNNKSTARMPLNNNTSATTGFYANHGSGGNKLQDLLPK